MINNIPILKDIVLLGGGHSHVHTLKSFGMKPIEGVRLTLISRDVYTPYSGMLPGFIAGHYSWEECHLDLMKLCSYGNIRFINAEVCGLDTKNRLIYCKDGRPPISYDILSVDIGIIPKPFLSSINQYPYLIPVKPIDKFAKVWERMKQRVLEITKPVPTRIAVIGGGAGGVELCFSMYESLTNRLRKNASNDQKVQIIIVSRGDVLLPGHNVEMQRLTKELINEKNIELYLGADVIGVDEKSSSVTRDGDSNGHYHHLVSADGRRIPFDEAVVCTQVGSVLTGSVCLSVTSQASAQEWLQHSGLQLSPDGFIDIQPTLESTNTKGVFACGDVSHMAAHPRPKAGVFAVRAGPILTDNIRRLLRGEPLEAWEPQSQFLGIIGTGEGLALASKGPIALKGEYLWTLKQKIDREWMEGYQHLPNKGAMNAAPSSGDGVGASDSAQFLRTVASERVTSPAAMMAAYTMRCGACGSKVSAQLLSRALRRVSGRIPSHPAVVAGINQGSQSDDAALIRTPSLAEGEVPLLAQSIDFFRSPEMGSGFASDPYVFGKIAATHALSDLHAMGAAPVSAMALCVLPVGPADKGEDTLVQLLAGACEVLAAEGCALVGGHTSEAMVGDRSPAMGLSVTGLVAACRVLRKGPLSPGLALVLTKPLGVGVLMVADMQAEAKGTWVAAALQSMLTSNGVAARILVEHGCTHCTDVTGFGLVGHLLEMLSGGDDDEVTLGAELELDAVPVLPGAVECAAMGLRSSIHAENSANNVRVEAPSAAYSHRSFPLLWDPQTCGGLLAGLPVDSAQRAVEELRKAGYPDAAVIGTVVNRQRSSLSCVIDSKVESQGCNDAFIRLL